MVLGLVGKIRLQQFFIAMVTATMVHVRSQAPVLQVQQWTTSPSVAQWKIKILKAQTSAPPLVPVFNNHHHCWPETMDDHLTTAGHFQWACFGLQELMID